MPDKIDAQFPGDYVLADVVQEDPFGPVEAYVPVAFRRAIGPREIFEFDDMRRSDFPTSQPFGEMNWQAFNLGGGGATVTRSVAGVDPTTRAVGAAAIVIGSSASGAAGLYNLGSLQLGADWFELAARIQVGALSTAAEEFRIAFGFHDDAVSNTDAPTDAAYFRYNRATDGNFWTLVTRSNSVESKVVSAAPVTTSWVNLRILVPTSDRVIWYVNGSPVGTLRTNIPTGSGRQTQMVLKAFKTAGTTSRSVFVDWTAFRWWGRDR